MKKPFLIFFITLVLIPVASSANIGDCLSSLRKLKLNRAFVDVKRNAFRQKYYDTNCVTPEQKNTFACKKISGLLDGQGYNGLFDIYYNGHCVTVGTEVEEINYVCLGQSRAIQARCPLPPVPKAAGKSFQCFEMPNFTGGPSLKIGTARNPVEVFDIDDGIKTPRRRVSSMSMRVLDAEVGVKVDTFGSCVKVNPKSCRQQNPSDKMIHHVQNVALMGLEYMGRTLADHSLRKTLNESIDALGQDCKAKGHSHSGMSAKDLELWEAYIASENAANKREAADHTSWYQRAKSSNSFYVVGSQGHAEVCAQLDEVVTSCASNEIFKRPEGKSHQFDSINPDLCNVRAQGVERLVDLQQYLHKFPALKKLPSPEQVIIQNITQVRTKYGCEQRMVKDPTRTYASDSLNLKSLINLSALLEPNTAGRTARLCVGIH